MLSNLYRDGNDNIGKHSDDEKDLVDNTLILSISLGSTRDFVFQHKRTKDV